MAAGLVGDHSFAGPAIIGRIEEDGDDSEFVEGKLPEQGMGLERSIKTSNPRMVPADDEMSASVVLPNEGMKQGFPWSGIPHRPRENPQNDPGLWVIALKKNLIAIHPDPGRNVVFLGFTDKGVKEKPVHHLE